MIVRQAWDRIDEFCSCGIPGPADMKGISAIERGCGGG